MVNSERLGIWITKDGQVETPDPSNPYRYVENDPTNLTDPSGLFGVGHHWVPVEIVMEDEFYKKLSPAALAQQAGAVSAPTLPRHGSGTYGGITHDKYSDIVRDELRKYMKTNGITSSTKMTGQQMYEFAQMMRDGKGSTPANSKALKAFNQAVMGQRTALENASHHAKLWPNSKRDNQKRGKKVILNDSRYKTAILLAGLTAAVQDMLGLLSTASASPHYRGAIEALQRGDIVGADRHISGSDGYGGIDSFIVDLQKSGDANVQRNSLVLLTAWHALYKKAIDRTREIQQQVRNLPDDPPGMPSTRQSGSPAARPRGWFVQDSEGGLWPVSKGSVRAIGEFVPGFDPPLWLLRWFGTKAGQAWLQGPAGLTWMSTAEGHNWLSSRSGQNWLMNGGVRPPSSAQAWQAREATVQQWQTQQKVAYPVEGQGTISYVQEQERLAKIHADAYKIRGSGPPTSEE